MVRGQRSRSLFAQVSSYEHFGGILSHLPHMLTCAQDLSNIKTNNQLFTQIVLTGRSNVCMKHPRFTVCRCLVDTSILQAVKSIASSSVAVWLIDESATAYLNLEEHGCKSGTTLFPRALLARWLPWSSLRENRRFSPKAISSEFTEKWCRLNKSIVRWGWYSKKITGEHSDRAPLAAASVWVMFPGAAIMWPQVASCATPSRSLYYKPQSVRSRAFQPPSAQLGWHAVFFFFCFVACARPGENCTTN